MGGYGIVQQFADPLEAQSADLPFFALLIATAVTLLYCLLHPSRKKRYGIATRPVTVSWAEAVTVVARSASCLEEGHKAIQLHRRYVDRALVRIER
jgi:hypothetical protein